MLDVVPSGGSTATSSGSSTVILQPSASAQNDARARTSWASTVTHWMRSDMGSGYREAPIPVVSRFSSTLGTKMQTTIEETAKHTVRLQVEVPPEEFAGISIALTASCPARSRSRGSGRATCPGRSWTPGRP